MDQPATAAKPEMTEAAPPPHAVWVLDDPRAGDSDQAIAIAERLGVPFRRIPLSWNWLAPMAALARRGSLLGLSAPARGIASRAQPWSVAAPSRPEAPRTEAPRTEAPPTEAGRTEPGRTEPGRY